MTTDIYFYAFALKEKIQLGDVTRMILQSIHTLIIQDGLAAYKNNDFNECAKELLSLGNNTENGVVCYRLAHMYRYGKGFKSDIKKGFELYTRAMGLLGETPVELFYKGVICYDGLSGEKNFEKAVTYYEASARMGYPEAMTNLGVCYRHGNGVVQNYQTALKYFLRASKKENILAHCHVGYLYEFGLGVKCNLKKAVRYYTKASIQNDLYAKERLEFIYKNHTL